MRCLLVSLSLLCWLAQGVSAQAATGRVIKVLPQFLDLQGRHTISPSLYERDAYQVQLRQHPEQRSGIRFNVQYKVKAPAETALTLRVEMRGFARGDLPRQLTLEQPVKPGGWFGRWTGLSLVGDQYKEFGDVTAWRVTLWEEGKLLGEQKSFLW